MLLWVRERVASVYSPEFTDPGTTKARVEQLLKGEKLLLDNNVKSVIPFDDYSTNLHVKDLISQ